MTKVRFTDRWVQSSQSPTLRSDFSDLLCPGLHLRVTKRGIKTYSVMFRLHGKLHRRTLGRYPATTLAKAREQAREIQSLAAAGVDSRSTLSKSENTLTYTELVDMYVEKYLKSNARSWQDIRGSLFHKRLRHLRTRTANSITKADIIEVLDNFVESGTPQAAVNVLRRLKMLFSWAFERDYVNVNPCLGIRPPAKTVERDRTLTNAEISAIWYASFKLDKPYGQMYRMYILTGQRRGEVSTIQWHEIIGEEWVIPREKVKKDRSHSVPLSPIALQTLLELPKYADDGFVFTTTGGKSPSSNFSKIKTQLDALSGVTKWKTHDIRRTVRSKLAQLGVSREVARKIMNHEDSKVDRIYNRYEYSKEKREALNLWSIKLKQIIC